jgi:hypothetical protein
MPVLNVSEYLDASHGNPIEPPVAHCVLELGEEAADHKFNRSTRLVRIVADVNSLIGIGPEPEAVQPIAAGRPEQRIIHPDAGYRIAAKLASPDSQDAGGSASGAVAFLQFVQVLADGSKSKALAEKLDRKHADARAAIRELGDLKAAATALQKERGAFESMTVSTRAKLQEDRDALAADREQLKAELREHSEAVAKLTADRAALEQSRKEHEADLGEFARMRKLFAA